MYFANISGCKEKPSLHTQLATPLLPLGASELSGHRMQPGAPPSEPAKPRLHTQDAADTLPAGLSVSTGQAVQTEAPLAEYMPAAQLAQVEAPTALENLPAAQLAQVMAPDCAEGATMRRMRMSTLSPSAMYENLSYRSDCENNFPVPEHEVLKLLSLHSDVKIARPFANTRQHALHGYATVTATASASYSASIQPPAGMKVHDSCDHDPCDHPLVAVGKLRSSVRYS
jgi:hypothetical protein